MQVIDAADFEIERRLDSYARARLAPDPRAAARIRARVMREARLQFEAARIAVHVMPAVARANHRSLTRRVVMPFLAAAVWLGIAVGSISAAQAGGPLYPARMWIEEATLPAGLAPRTAAELERMDARLAEAVAAAGRGDARGVSAALEAYRGIADGAIASSAGDASLETLVTSALDHHRVVLSAVAQRLAERGNATAAGALEGSIQRAIEHNQAVIDRLEAAGGASGAGQPGGAGAGATNGGTGPAAKPDRTPRPTPAKPNKPDQTPRGGPDS